MQHWHDFLQQQGFTLLPQGGIEAAEADAATYLTSLSNYGSLSVSGPDTHKFLQGQLSCDLDKLSSETWQTGAYCTPKGSVIANFDLLQLDQTLHLHMAADVVPEVYANLSKYIVFSKAELTHETDNWVRLGIWGEQAHQALQTLVNIPATEGALQAFAEGFVFCTSSAQQRFVIYCQPAAAPAIWQTLSDLAQPSSTARWEANQIKDGLLYVNGTISGQYVPQMLNLQELGSIDFQKGCYTGQEVVARMQYLGKLKRHLHICHIHSAEPLEVGMNIAATGRSNVGQITSVAKTAANEYWCTAVINIKEAASDSLAVDSIADSTISLQPLPYTIDPQVFERIKL